MKKITLYEYNKKNFDAIQQTLSDKLRIITINDIETILKEGKDNSDNQKLLMRKDSVWDITFLISITNERTDLWLLYFIQLLEHIKNDTSQPCFIVNKNYSKSIAESAYFFVDEIQSLEALLDFEDNLYRNIVDLTTDDLNDFENHISSKIFGNVKLKRRLFEEIRKFRLFNRIGEQPIFSAFLAGDSGIGKTEIAKQIHSYLSPNDPLIKINLGNYSDQHALSSLIGSPRGYHGSDNGELSDKINNSNSSVILIDEFEKASLPIFNFFLELLSDGIFTDSLGREYNLNKYIIIFTSNLSEEKMNATIPPELRSRFNLLYKLVALSRQEKTDYVQYRTEYYLEKISYEYDLPISPEAIKRISSIDVTMHKNMRNLNKQIELNILDDFKSDLEL